MPSEGQFGLCCCDNVEPLRSNATVRAMVPYHGFRVIEPWMIGDWHFNNSTGVGSGPNGASGTTVATGINTILAAASRLSYWPSAEGWNMNNGDTQQHYAQWTMHSVSVGEWPEYTDGTGTHPAGSETVTFDRTDKVDPFSDAKWWYEITQERVLVNYPLYPTGERNATLTNSFNWSLGEDGVASTAFTLDADGQGPGSWGTGHAAADSYDAVSAVSVSETMITVSQTWHNPASVVWATYNATITFSEPFTPAEVVEEAQRLLGTVNLATVAAGDWLIKWVWADGTPKGVSLAANLETAPTGSEYLWRVLGAYQVSQLTKRRHLTGTVVEDMERAEQTMWVTRTTPPWGTNDGAPPIVTGVIETIPDYAAPNVVILMYPELVDTDIGSYTGFSLGRASIAP
jgi:hypothetical protein